MVPQSGLCLVYALDRHCRNLKENYSENFDATLNENWGNSDNNFTYRQQAIEPINLNSFELNFDVQNVFETFIPTPNIPIDSDKIFDLFLENQKKVPKRFLV